MKSRFEENDPAREAKLTYIIINMTTNENNINNYKTERNVFFVLSRAWDKEKIPLESFPKQVLFSKKLVAI